jgi:hypothetical protein
MLKGRRAQIAELEYQKVNGWGGKRRGAGRPNRSGTVSHMKRHKVDFNKPLSLTMKVKRGVPSLRQRIFLKGFKQSIQGARIMAFMSFIILCSIIISM